MQLTWRWHAAQEVVANVRPKLRNDSDMTQAPFSLPSGHHMAIIFKSATSSQMESDTKFTTFFLDIASPSLYLFFQFLQTICWFKHSVSCLYTKYHKCSTCTRCSLRTSLRMLFPSKTPTFSHILQNSPKRHIQFLPFHMNQTIFALTSKHSDNYLPTRGILSSSSNTDSTLLPNSLNFTCLRTSPSSPQGSLT